MANPNPKPPPKHGQIKKGEVRNPKGAGAHDPLIRALRKLTIKSFRECLELVLTGNTSQLKKLAEDPKSSALLVGIATSMGKAIKNGDYGTIERIAERIVGKLPEHVIVESSGQLNVNFDKAKLKAILDKVEKDV